MRYRIFFFLGALSVAILKDAEWDYWIRLVVVLIICIAATAIEHCGKELK